MESNHRSHGCRLQFPHAVHSSKSTCRNKACEYSKTKSCWPQETYSVYRPTVKEEAGRHVTQPGVSDISYRKASPGTCMPRTQLYLPNYDQTDPPIISATLKFHQNLCSLSQTFTLWSSAQFLVPCFLRKTNKCMSQFIILIFSIDLPIMNISLRLFKLNATSSLHKMGKLTGNS